jgi:FixJ family two-component response regulator
MSSAVIVFVVDDDIAVLKALTRLLNAEGFGVRAFASPQAFLEQHDPAVPGCLVLDMGAALLERRSDILCGLLERADLKA